MARRTARRKPHVEPLRRAARRGVRRGLRGARRGLVALNSRAGPRGRRFGLRTAVTFLGFVLAVNLTVRRLGGDAHPLSLRHLDNKVVALGLLARHGLSHVFGEHSGEPRALVERAALEVQLPTSLAIRVARAESDLRPHVISATGAMGLMQLMPDTAREYEVDDPFDPADNARGATRYLRYLFRRYRGDKRRVLAAYNVGPGRVPRRGPYSIPAETRRYIRRVLGTRR